MISKTGLVHLSCGPASATISPRGGVLQRWHDGTRDLLFFRTDIPNRSSHPCVPIFGPLYDPVTREKLPKATIQGKTLELPQHGFGKTLKWNGNLKNPDQVQLSLLNPPDGSRSDIMQMYPFPFQSDLITALTGEDSLFYRLVFQNLGQETAPVDLACHLYLQWEKGLTIHGLDGLEFDDTTQAWETLTSGRVNGPADFSDEKNRDWEISLQDGTGLRDTFEICYPSGYSLVLKIFRQTAREIEVWTKPEIGPFICVEPVARGRGALQSIQGRTPIQAAPHGHAELAFGLTVKEN